MAVAEKEQGSRGTVSTLRGHRDRVAHGAEEAERLSGMQTFKNKVEM